MINFSNDFAMCKEFDNVIKKILLMILQKLLKNPVPKSSGPKEVKYALFSIVSNKTLVPDDFGVGLFLKVIGISSKRIYLTTSSTSLWMVNFLEKLIMFLLLIFQWHFFWQWKTLSHSYINQLTYENLHQAITYQDGGYDLHTSTLLQAMTYLTNLWAT